jgi:partner of Y14 and mago protein
MSKSAKKNAKRKEKKQEKQEIKDNWEDDDATDETAGNSTTIRSTTGAVHSSESPNWAVAVKVAREKVVDGTNNEASATDADGLSSGFSKLDVR